MGGGSPGRTELFAPALLPFECANVVRRQELSGTVSSDQAIQAHADLIDLPVEMWPFDLLGDRVWELRSNLTSYDASYVALGELLDASVVTLDRRIGRAPGLRCLVVDPASVG